MDIYCKGCTGVEVRVSPADGVRRVLYCVVNLNYNFLKFRLLSKSCSVGRLEDARGKF